jgi:pyruvate,water dikinase
MKFIKRFAECGLDDVALVGGKNASLGEMYSKLTALGVKVPNGFAVTAEAYRYFLRHNNIDQTIADILAAVDINNLDSLEKAGSTIRNLIMHATLPDDLEQEILQAYTELQQEYGDLTEVAVRSSATAEDLPDASFAGQQETYLNISGDKNLLLSVLRVFASLYTDRAISYRNDQDYSQTEVALSAGIQKMVRSDLSSSGVIFTLDTESGFPDVVFITSAYGLGENVVKGAVNPDEFYVFKNTLDDVHRPILRKHLGSKAIKMIYSKDPATGISTTNVSVNETDRKRFSIDDDDVLTLARHAVVIEKHYSNRAGKPVPLDIEWAKDGKTGELFIVQARPETVQSVAAKNYLESFILESRGEILCAGKSVGARIATGKARIIMDRSSMHELKPGEILVTDITDPDWEPVMKIAGGIITNRGGRTCHAAIVARELGIPAIVGCGNATDLIPDMEMITMSCAEGDQGYIYKGEQPFHVDKLDTTTVAKTRTRIMLNLGNPDIAFDTSMLPVDGVGLARLEFIINNHIKIHPSAILHLDRVDRNTRKIISDTASAYPDAETFYVNKLAEGIGTIAAAFYPKQVIVRMSDFKSNEYASLIGGSGFEPEEENPMIGYRGAYRYHATDFKECFALECRAIRRVIDIMGLDNISLMIPFVRSVAEGVTVLELLKQFDIRRDDKMRIYLMCELPANVILADEFLEHFDGFSIGSNDLTQLTLGVDRDSGIITGFDERNAAVLKSIETAINACKRHNKYVGICGQAPSDFPEITRWLVEREIDSISLNPDSVLKMLSIIADVEKKRQ